MQSTNDTLIWKKVAQKMTESIGEGPELVMAPGLWKRIYTSNKLDLVSAVVRGEKKLDQAVREEVESKKHLNELKAGLEMPATIVIKPGEKPPQSVYSQFVINPDDDGKDGIFIIVDQVRKILARWLAKQIGPRS